MALDPLATADDLEARTGVDFSTDAKAAAALADASAAVRAEAGQEFTVATSTAVWLPVRNGRVRLPQRPVTAVNAVADEYDNAVPFTWLEGSDFLRLSTSSPLNQWELEPRRTPLGLVAVTYTHGSSTVPELVVAITCNVALRALGRDPRDGSIIAETVAGYTYQTGAVGGAGPVGLLSEEKLRLARFKRPHSYSVQG